MSINRRNNVQSLVWSYDRIPLSNKTEPLVLPMIWISIKIVMLSERSPMQKVHTVWAPLYGGSRTGNLIYGGKKIRVVVVLGGGWRGTYCLVRNMREPSSNGNGNLAEYGFQIIQVCAFLNTHQRVPLRFVYCIVCKVYLRGKQSYKEIFTSN